jgi:hypothetical protein
MKYAKMMLAFAMCALCALAAVWVAQSAFGAAVSTNVRRIICPYTGGRFGDTADRCFTRSCYAERNCGKWSDPGARCAALKPGDPVSEVYFQLGEPHGQDGGSYWWRAGKEAPGVITARIGEGKLQTLNCAQK